MLLSELFLCIVQPLSAQYVTLLSIYERNEGNIENSSKESFHEKNVKTLISYLLRFHEFFSTRKFLLLTSREIKQ